MIVDKYGNYVQKCMWQLCGWDRVDISLTIQSRANLKILKSTRNGIKKIKCILMKCHTNGNHTPPTQLPHTFLYIGVILIHNHFESPNISATLVQLVAKKKRETKIFLM
jgi:hypothetical protein